MTKTRTLILALASALALAPLAARADSADAQLAAIFARMDAIDRSATPAKPTVATTPVRESEPLEAWAHAPQSKSVAAPMAAKHDRVFDREPAAGA
ncbi:MAG: hypothetical protein ACK5TK_09720 [Betaproteobacteria bacterium]